MIAGFDGWVRYACYYDQLSNLHSNPKAHWTWLASNVFRLLLVLLTSITYSNEENSNLESGNSRTDLSYSNILRLTVPLHHSPLLESDTCVYIIIKVT